MLLGGTGSCIANSKSSSGIRNLMYSGKHVLLPPKIPFPSVSQAYSDYLPIPEKHDSVESGAQDAKSSSERKDGTNAKSAASEIDTRCTKQQFAQRSRVRKLQYIAELERNVCGLQAEGSEVSAELEFLNQQNLILSMENKALKHHLDSLAQEQFIKYLEQEVLEREIRRLRALYLQQQQPPRKPSAGHNHQCSNNLETQFASLSLKHRTPIQGVIQ